MNKNIFLIGFSTSGKTSVGIKLAKKLKCNFYDTDSLIEKKSKMIIPYIFEIKGEKWFREEEKKIIRQLLRRKERMVIALGGGSFQNKESREQIIKSGDTIYLQCSQNELYRRIRYNNNRPLLNSKSRKDLKNKIKSLISKRLDNYKKADYTISTTNRSIENVANEIIKKISND